MRELESFKIYKVFIRLLGLFNLCSEVKKTVVVSLYGLYITDVAQEALNRCVSEEGVPDTRLLLQSKKSTNDM